MKSLIMQFSRSVCHVLSHRSSWDSSVDIATGYALDGRGIWVQLPTGTKDSYLSVQTGSGAHPATYPMGIGGSFPGGKVARA
jgi:hypothetical protein